VEKKKAGEVSAVLKKGEMGVGILAALDELSRQRRIRREGAFHHNPDSDEVAIQANHAMEGHVQSSEAVSPPTIQKPSEPAERQINLEEDLAIEKAAAVTGLEDDQEQAAIPPMPLGVCLLTWRLREPPVVIDTCSVVIDPYRFALTTLEQLRLATAEPGRWVGWTVPQLVDRLHQVGVHVALAGNLRGAPSL
jgi:hypothetical protein